MAKYVASNSRNDVTYRLGPNKFTDMTPQEFKKLLGYKKVSVDQGDTKELDASKNADSIDWNAKGKVQKVKDQASCGSCWAFSAVGALESAHAIKNNQLLSLSEQQLVDCSGKFGNEGCNGGEMYEAFQYAEEVPLETEAEYPYEAVDDSCRADKSKGKVTAKTFHRVPKNSADQLKAAINVGPVSVAIQADTWAFQGYQGGVLNDDSCGTNLDHGVLAVGYGVEDGQEFYLVKNSWGAGWGEHGFIKIAVVDGPGICGIQKDAVYPEVI